MCESNEVGIRLLRCYYVQRVRRGLFLQTHTLRASPTLESQTHPSLANVPPECSAFRTESELDSVSHHGRRYFSSSKSRPATFPLPLATCANSMISYPIYPSTALYRLRRLPLLNFPGLRTLHLLPTDRIHQLPRYPSAFTNPAAIP